MKLQLAFWMILMTTIPALGSANEFPSHAPDDPSVLVGPVGRDSVGQVFLKAKIDGKTISGQGTSTDIVEASARALVNALDKARHAEWLESASLNAIYLWGV